MENFEQRLEDIIKNKILNDLKKLDLVTLGYSDRIKIPKEFIDKIWNSVSWEEVLEEIRPSIQTRICNTIIANMETELKTDIKKVLSVAGVRQKLRMEIYPKLMEILNSGSGDPK